MELEFSIQIISLSMKATAWNIVMTLSFSMSLYLVYSINKQVANESECFILHKM
jgi:hypothetical protein